MLCIFVNAHNSKLSPQSPFATNCMNINFLMLEKNYLVKKNLAINCIFLEKIFSSLSFLIILILTNIEQFPIINKKIKYKNKIN